MRSTAARYYADLARGFHARADGGGVDAAQKLVRLLLAAASHVDRCTQLGAPQALLWYALVWDSDKAAISIAVECMQIVVLCLQTSHLNGPDGLQVQALALQLGGRLLRPHSKARAAGDEMPREFILHLWRGTGFLEPAARGFCRDAVKELRLHVGVAAVQAARAASKESIPWARLVLDDTRVIQQQEAAVVACSHQNTAWQALWATCFQASHQQSLVARAGRAYSSSKFSSFGETGRAQDASGNPTARIERRTFGT